MKKIFYFMAGGLCFFLAPSSHASTQHYRWDGPEGRSLVFEVLNDQVFRFEFFKDRAESISLAENSLVMAGSFPGPSKWEVRKNGFRTKFLSLELLPQKFCFKVYDRVAQKNLTEICRGEEGLLLQNPQMTDAYGLGEQFFSGAEQSLNWVGNAKTPGNEFGNKMVSFEGGAVGNAQFPMLYALGKGTFNFGFLMDNVFAQKWNLRGTPWKVEYSRGPSRGFFLGGKDLPELREQLLALIGKPPRFPKKAFGLWVSEYGFDNWAEIQGHWETLKAAKFPVAGFVLDLQWFGGVSEGSETSPVGALQWDLNHFPDPKQKIQDWKKKGIGLIAVEEPYISRKTLDRKLQKTVHEILAQKKFLVQEGPGKDANPVLLEEKLWWGLGGMMDYTNEAAADFWHDWKRQDLVNLGIMGHWTDLGEPEGFRATAFYNQGRWSHDEIHNIYNLKWSESIFRGYERNRVVQRPWILSRSGTLGSQRFGVSLWSGDIGANFESLKAHIVAQNNLFLVGMDSFGSDVGGFQRKALRGNLNDLYTQWFAHAAFFEFPIRPHTENLCNCRETAPDRIGNLASNRENLRLRAALNPYYYSLGIEAQQKGASMIVPLVYWFQADEKTRRISDHKMIGPNLLGVDIVGEGLKEHDVYLPAGNWFDFRSGEPLKSSGQWFQKISFYRDGKFQLPLYAKEGGIFPMAPLTEDGASLPDLVVRVYPSSRKTRLEFFEDDGWSTAYLRGETAKTPLEQESRGNAVLVRIGATSGVYEGIAASRLYEIEVITSVEAKKVFFNGKEIPKGGGAIFWEQKPGMVRIRMGSLPQNLVKDVEVR